MKTNLSLLITAMILLAGGAIYWHQRDRLSAGNESRRHVVSLLEERGIATGMDETPKRSRLRSSAEGQQERMELVRRLTLDLADLVSRDAGDKHQLNAEERAANAKKMAELYAQVMDLDFEDQLMVMRTISEGDDLERRVRWEILCAIAPSMARKDPERLLDFMIEESGSLHKINLGVFHHLWVPAMVTLAQEDVATAMRYFRKYDDKAGGPLSGQDWVSIIHGLAAVDPAAAFGMAKELGALDSIGYIFALDLRGKPEGNRARVLELMRSQGDEKSHRQFLEKTGEFLTDESFEETLPWLNRAGLTKAELTMMIEGMEPATSSHKDTGEWLEWSMSQVPEVAVTKVTDTMESWTKSDYMAAGEWLVELPDGPFKRAAVLGYAGAAAPYDPEGAAAWVATLPAGPERGELARKVLENWEEESGARSAFARREGIDP